MGTKSSDLNHLLSYALNEHSETMSSELLAHYTPEQVVLRHYKKGQFLITAGEPVRNLFLSLNGRVNVIKYKADGQCAILNDNDDVLYGLDEVLNGSKYYYASVICMADMDCLSIQSCYFLREINQDIHLAHTIIHFLSKMVHRHAYNADNRLLYSERENLLFYLMQACNGKTFPVILEMTRTNLADILGLNLRTLYRYLRRFKQEGLLGIVNGKIVLTEAQYRKITKKVETF